MGQSHLNTISVFNTNVIQIFNNRFSYNTAIQQLRLTIVIPERLERQNSE